MNKEIKQFLCGIFINHCFYSTETECKWNRETNAYTITETCRRCGKKFSFTAPAKILDCEVENMNIGNPNKEQPKLCPFCGWGTIVDGGGFFSHACECNSCGAKTKNYKTWEQAIKAWNRRI